jgi:hypothetical protein
MLLNKPNDFVPEVKVHDIFNIVVLSILLTVNLIYLIKLPYLALGESLLFFILFSLTTVYFVIDTIWIFFVPKAVLSRPATLMVHHILAVLSLSIPLFYGEFRRYMPALLLLEVNTLLLTLRRNCMYGSRLYQLLDISFKLSWVSFRLVMLPILFILFIHEYGRLSIVLGTYLNVGIIAIVMQSFLIVMSYIWTYSILKRVDVDSTNNSNK